MAKVYVWLKLPRTFFENKLIKKMRQLPGGDSCVIVYQRLLSEAALNDGIIEIDNIEEDVSQELALIINEDAKVIKMVLVFCQQYDLVKTLVDSNNLLFPQALEMTGRETDSARRMREKRKKDREKLASTDVKQLGERHIVTPVLQPVIKRDTELETEIELEIEKDKELEVRDRDRVRNTTSVTTGTPILSLTDIIELYKSKFPNVIYKANTELGLQILFNKFGGALLAAAITYAANYNGSAPNYLLKVIESQIKEGKADVRPMKEQVQDDDLLY